MKQISIMFLIVIGVILFPHIIESTRESEEIINYTFNPEKVHTITSAGVSLNAMSVDDKYIYHNYSLNIITIYDKNTYEVIRTIEYPSAVHDIKSNGVYLFVGGADQFLRVYDTTTWEIIWTSTAYGGEINAVNYYDNYLYYGGNVTKRIYKIDMTTWEKVDESTVFDMDIINIHVDNQYIYGSCHIMRIYNHSFDLLYTSNPMTPRIRALVANEKIYLGGDTGKFRVINKQGFGEILDSTDFYYDNDILTMDYYNFLVIGGTRGVVFYNSSNYNPFLEFDITLTVENLIINDMTIYYATSDGNLHVISMYQKNINLVLQPATPILFILPILFIFVIIGAGVIGLSSKHK